MNSDRGLPNTRPDLLSVARYQIVPGAQGLARAQIELRFRRDLPVVANPDMTLAVLLDRSGSMREAFRDGHVYNVTSAILQAVSAAGAGFDLVFYDDQISDAGHIGSVGALREAIAQNGPRGTTFVTEALRETVRKYHKKRGMYIIVITDGEFGDKAQVEQLVVRDLMPQLTPENPYAFRLHFVGAGEGVDHAFLRRIEAAASGQGIPLVTQHHHAHLSHSHASILDEIDKAFLGVGIDARFGDPAALTASPPGDPAAPGASPSGDPAAPGGDGGAGTESAGAGALAVLHTVDVPTARAWEGPVGSPGFLPRRALLGCDYAGMAAETLPIGVRFQPPGGAQVTLTIPVPLPRVAGVTGADEAAAGPSPAGQALAGEAAGPAPAVPTSGPAPPAKPRFHLPWVHRTPEQEEARAEAERQRALLQQLTIQNRQAEQARQMKDMAALSQGGLPVQATERLREIGRAGEEGALFTSDLDPDEAALLRREGFKARGLVTGSAMYHVGQAFASAYQDCEVDVLSKAYDKATDLAVSRMGKELRLIGAHGVVGVRLSMVRHEWADKTVEVQVMGTAVEGPGKPPADPWMCDLSGQEWYALHRAGYEPAALVWGHCTWFILTTQQDEWTERSWVNSELTHWSQALGTARHIAMGTLVRQARTHKATGVAGVRIARRLDEVRLTGLGENPVYEREHHNLAVSIIGTAIRVRADAPAGVTPTVQVLSLRDGRLAPAALGAGDLKIE
jgi:uncharacterized protein YbjQ (UPF0145 family)